MAPPVGKRVLMISVVSPILVFDHKGDDLAVYPSLMDAERHLEAIDVRNNEYEAFDAEGRLLRLTTENETVRIISTEGSPDHAAALRTRLRAFLKKAKAPTFDDSSLPQLLAAVDRFTNRSAATSGILKRIFRKQ